MAKDGYQAVIDHWSGVCYSHVLSDSCRKGQACPLSHEALEVQHQVELRAALAAKKEAGGGSRPSSPAASPRSSAGSAASDDELIASGMCLNMAKDGACSHGDNCLWMHERTEAERQRAEAVKARRKGKGKGKGKSKPNAAAALGWEAAGGWAPMS